MVFAGGNQHAGHQPIFSITSAIWDDLNIIRLPNFFNRRNFFFETRIIRARPHLNSFLRLTKTTFLHTRHHYRTHRNQVVRSRTQLSFTLRRLTGTHRRFSRRRQVTANNRGITISTRPLSPRRLHRTHNRRLLRHVTQHRTFIIHQGNDRLLRHPAISLTINRTQRTISRLRVLQRRRTQRTRHRFVTSDLGHPNLQHLHDSSGHRRPHLHTLAQRRRHLHGM